MELNSFSIVQKRLELNLEKNRSESSDFIKFSIFRKKGIFAPSSAKLAE